MSKLHIDFETRSTADLKKTGVHVYATDPTTDLWCAAYAIDDGPVELWVPGEPCPPAIVDHILFDDGPVIAHNAPFERNIWRHILTPRYGWLEVPLERWRCTMAMAYAMSLPGSLENAAAAVGLTIAKDMAGHRLMLQMAKPRRVDGKQITWWDQEEKRQRLYAYCQMDVEVERQLEMRLAPLPAFEQKLWQLDRIINERGVKVDAPLCVRAKKIVADHTDKLNGELSRITDGHVTAVTNTGQIIQYLRTHGLDTGSIAKDQVQELLALDLPPVVRRVVEIREEGSKASVAKIDALLNGMSADGRARELLQYHAASTGRWAGRRFQPQNIKRPSFRDVDFAIDMLMSTDAETIDQFLGPPLSIVGDCLRGMVRADEGKKIVAADFSNIEGRVLAWLAGERWKVEAFHAFDAGEGPDLYKLAYSRSFNTPVDSVTKDQRQIGKVMELALGYQGGVGAFQSMAVNYGLKVSDEVADDLKTKWRSAHPKVVSLWSDLDKAAFEAVDTGNVVHCGRITFKVSGSFLVMRLPSRRCLYYAFPTIVSREMPWKDDAGNPISRECVGYWGVNSYSRKWEQQYLYGGKIVENAVQAIARDVMAYAMFRIEEAGYPIILTVHDEIVSEPAADFGSKEHFEALMREVPSWADGLPIAAKGFEAPRYRK